MSSPTATAFTVHLTGTSPQPLGRYLKALGILRLVSEQLDPLARGTWKDGTFCLTSTADIEALVDFLVNRYVPTPLASPWNSGSGFGQKDPASSKAAFGALNFIAESDDPRLADYRDAIAAARRLAARPDWFDLDKEQQVALCRNEFPDAALDWLDTAVVLTSEHRAFPPLLGTGGNDGRFDFSSNYMQRLLELLGHEKRKRTQTSITELARFALVEDTNVPLDEMAVGQFDPAGAGGPAAVPFGPSRSIGNPWDFVLLLEGALLFASGAARRLSSTNPHASVPFTVTATHAGHPTATSDEQSRGELWAPLWSRPATLPEITQLLNEGRVEYNGHQAGSGLDVARAVASLGVDHGIDGFVRHSFLERNGLATFAIPVGFYPVGAIEGAQVLAQLDSWTDRLRRVKNPPASLTSGLRQIQDAQFAAAGSHDNKGLYQQVLITAARIDRLAARSSQLREHSTKASLSADDWTDLLDDGSPEFEVAVALASLRSHRGATRGWLADLFFDPHHPERPGKVPALDGRPIVRTLAECAIALAIDPPVLRHPANTNKGPGTTQESEKRNNRRLPKSPQEGAVAVAADWRAVHALAFGDLDDEKLRDLLGALMLLNWSSWSRGSSGNSRGAGQPEPLLAPSSAFAVLAPLFARRPWTQRFENHRAVATHTWSRRLAAGQISAVSSEARRRYRIAGLELLVANPANDNDLVDGQRLAAACLVPISDRGVVELLEQIARNPQPDQTSNRSDQE
jgi:CRISPR-associated protein Csx17